MSEVVASFVSKLVVCQINHLEIGLAQLTQQEQPVRCY